MITIDLTAEDFDKELDKVRATLTERKQDCIGMLSMMLESIGKDRFVKDVTYVWDFTPDEADFWIREAISLIGGRK